MEHTVNCFLKKLASNTKLNSEAEEGRAIALVGISRHE